MSKVSEEGRDYIAINEKGKDALESYRLARYAMHAQVYEHYVRLITDDMFSRAVILALKEGSLDKDSLIIEQDPVRFLEYYYGLDDDTINYLILTKSSGNAKKLLEDIRERKLLKRAYMVPLNAQYVPNPIKRDQLIQMSNEQIQKTERKIAKEVRVDPDFVFVHLQRIPVKLYELFELTSARKKNRY